MKTSGQKLWYVYRDPSGSFLAFELYWPEFSFFKNELFVACDTLFRIGNPRQAHGYKCFGFKVFGFGVAVAWRKIIPQIKVLYSLENENKQG